MAYIYDERTGEFINTSAPKPEVKKTAQTSYTSQASTTRTTTGGGSGARSTSSGIGDFFLGILGLALHCLPYLVIAGLVSLCS